MPHQSGPKTKTPSGGAQRARIIRLKKRADFLLAARGARAAMPGLVLQCRPSPETAEPGTVRVGFTATKKLGGAVVRNRVKRRLRAAATSVMPEEARPAHDYVLIGRSGTAERPFARLVEDLRTALRRVHRSEGGARRPGSNKQGRNVQKAGRRRNDGEKRPT